jgi:cell division protein FtsQ
MWDNHRLLAAIANTLYGLAGVLLAYAIGVEIVNLPIFPIRTIEVGGRITHTTRNQVQQVVTGELKGNFFTLDLEQARAAFEKLPWVRKANVRRQWPDRLQVELEEQVAVARWRDTALINTYAEVFQAASNQTLPVFIGPDSTAPEVYKQYQSFSRALEALGKRPREIVLSDRRAWRMTLDDGQILELGREQMDERLRRFVAAYPRTLAQLPAMRLRIDLRYPNGFTVRGS